MSPAITLTIPQKTHVQLQRHLFCGDGRESAAIILCSRTPRPRCRLLVKHVLLVPNEACTLRRSDEISWPGEYVEKAIDIAEMEGLAIILMHSHPGGMLAFSPVDDQSDKAVIPALFHALGDLHGTAIMVPDGTVRARLYTNDMKRRAVDLVSVAGDDLQYWWDDGAAQRPHVRPVAFTSEMTSELKRLTAIVIGVSGTGSPVAEQVARLGFGKVVLIDPDHVQSRNLNRIINASFQDAHTNASKVEMFAAAIARHRGDDVAQAVPASIRTRAAVLAASQGDVIFCCTDTVEARFIADLMCSAFLIPVFDVGVVIPVRRTDDGIAIVDAYARIDYVKPGGASLCDRGVYTPASLEAEYLKNAAPAEHRDRVNAGYMHGANEEAPAVISLNMKAAATCVLEFINRAYPFGEPNRKYARFAFSVGDRENEFRSEDSFASGPSMSFARGAAEPLLGLPELKVPRGRADV
ncbi:ThiF family adenylyltransferase [Pseudoduganella sp. DS3]|uniref:ThiF family adenylyltransferase n=1 Tax=Pseudoduganella guangdongensis TaxID=2692179 RepID=A0A6N9HPD9_9BURK|nr:ThiF family adenylyltransferase [Pseudoduganella guangdongensis]MYN04535.1 ThiF family adenylyltransferase [Pseudoduganella guangdongensis]